MGWTGGITTVAPAPPTIERWPTDPSTRGHTRPTAPTPPTWGLVAPPLPPLPWSGDLLPTNQTAAPSLMFADCCFGSFKQSMKPDSSLLTPFFVWKWPHKQLLFFFVFIKIYFIRCVFLSFLACFISMFCIFRFVAWAHLKKCLIFGLSEHNSTSAKLNTWQTKSSNFDVLTGQHAVLEKSKDVFLCWTEDI